MFGLQDNLFTSSTSQAAYVFATDVVSRLVPDFEVVQFKQYSHANLSAPGFYAALVDEAMALGADAMLGCDLKVDRVCMWGHVGARGCMWVPKCLFTL